MEKPDTHDSEWQAQAACVDKSYLFDLLELKTPQTQGMSGREVKMMNGSNFRVAEKICGRCPVIEECFRSADEWDLNWTYRAGLLPNMFNPRSAGRPRKTPVPPPPPPREDDGVRYCKMGHNDWFEYANQGKLRRTCRICNNDRIIRQRADNLRRAEVRMAEFEGRTCNNGHTGEYKIYANGEIRCRECNKYQNRKARAKAQGAKMAA